MEPYNVVVAPSVMVTIEEVYSYVHDELDMPRAAIGLVEDLFNAIESLSHICRRGSHSLTLSHSVRLACAE